MARMRELAVADPRRGHRHVMDLLHTEDWSIGTRLVRRLWRAEGQLVLEKRRKRRRIGTGENGIVRRRATRKDEVWGMDFVSDHTADGRPLRMLMVLHECTRECLAIEVGRHCRGEDVMRVLDELKAIRGSPAHIRSDNGPEFVSAAVRKWCEESGSGTLRIDPGSPWQKGIAESFNGRLRNELLSSEIVATLAEARLLVDRWLLHYNHRRILRALGKLTRRPSRRRTPRCRRSGSPRSPALWHRRAWGMAAMHQLSNGVDR